RRRPQLTHERLAEMTGIPRRTITRISDGTRKRLTDSEAEAILAAINRDDLYRELTAGLLTATLYEAWIESELEEPYEDLHIGVGAGNFPRDDEQALADLHEMYEMRLDDREIAGLPFEDRRKATIARFRERHGCDPHPPSDSLRQRALDILDTRRKY